MKSSVSLLVISLLLTLAVGVSRGQDPQGGAVGPDPGPLAHENTIHPLAAKHCSACHQPPRPGSMTRGAWPANFTSMAKWMREKDLPIDKEELTWLFNFYLENSPVAFTMPPDDFEPCGLDFEKLAVGDRTVGERPQVTNINVVDLDGDGVMEALVCDNELSEVSRLKFEDGEWRETLLARVNAPVKTAVFDYEGDGDLDIVVAGMGYMHPNDELIGEAHLLLNRGDQTFETIGLIQGVERIADIQAADFDGDGDTDFVVAGFGWRLTGGLTWLEQVSPNTFRSHGIFQINGPMRLEVLDYDGDGDQDFVVLITQQHESLVLFTNDGKGTFTNEILARGTHPAFGSSSFQLVDLDGDGDIDILQTNGDMMDEHPEWKPYHGIRWFENIGGDYQVRQIAAMPGCYCARAFDMDGDGDLDVVASSLYFFWEESDFPSLIWMENDGAQNFTRRRIAYAPTNLASIDIGDMNGDGIPDIVGGGMHVPGPLGRVGRLTLWLGQPSGEKPLEVISGR